MKLLFVLKENWVSKTRKWHWPVETVLSAECPIQMRSRHSCKGNVCLRCNFRSAFPVAARTFFIHVILLLIAILKKFLFDFVIGRQSSILSFTKLHAGSFLCRQKFALLRTKNSCFFFPSENYYTQYLLSRKEMIVGECLHLRIFSTVRTFCN